MSFIKVECKLECIMVIIHLKQGNWVSSAAGLMITEPKKASWLWTGLKRLWHAVFFTLFHWSCLPAEFARPGGEATVVSEPTLILTNVYVIIALENQITVFMLIITYSINSAVHFFFTSSFK
ncbi:Hypothetical_protein [Hexamita inflata]|uniref:Hypothetical_protein n=1 Tax=Hexamita inflata TaxID=28002 RepID=A0AA86NDA1_9EUKA|nr:Hypothetical protein HINF_LOCUS4888 [Hexamita inflata]